MKTYLNSLAIKLMVALVFALFAINLYAQDIGEADFLMQIFNAVKGFGGLNWGMKIIVICTLLTSSMKVSFLRQMIWDKLKGWKFVVAPVLALVIGMIGMKMDGNLNMVGLTAYFMAGMGSIILHELLDGIKELPFVGPKYDAIIDTIMKLLGGKKV